MKSINCHYQELSMWIAHLLLITQGVSSALQPCQSTPCIFPLADIHTAAQPNINDEGLATWDGHRFETNQLSPTETDDGYIYDISTGMPSRTRGEQDAKESYEEDRDDSQSWRGRFREPNFPKNPIVFFISRAPYLDPTQNGCTTSKNKDTRCLGRRKGDVGQVYAPQLKRSGYNGFQKWASAGLPFSVLYHHPKQVSRSKPNTGANGARAGNVQAAAQRSPESGQWVSQAGPVVTTRRQYSTLPHLFVSYGWGPLGK